METIGQVIGRMSVPTVGSTQSAQSLTTSPQPNRCCSPAIVCDDKGRFRISLYTDRYASTDDLKPLVAKLDAAFCNQFNSDQDRMRFFGLLIQRMIDNGFTVQRATDAVNYVIDNCRTYKQINIADVIQFDHTAECLTYRQMCNRAMAGDESVWNEYERVVQNGNVFYKPKRRI